MSARWIQGHFRWRLQLNAATFASGTGVIWGEELQMRETMFRGAGASVQRIQLQVWFWGLTSDLTILSKGVLVTPLYK